MHLQTMVDLCVAEYDCGTAQLMIDITRMQYANDAEMQLELDTKQSKLNETRRRIIHAQQFVASQN